VPSLPQYHNMDAVDFRRTDYDYFTASNPQQSRAFSLPTEAEVDSLFACDRSLVTSPIPRDSTYSQNDPFERQSLDDTHGNLSRQNSVTVDDAHQAEDQPEVGMGRMTLLAAQYAEILKYLSIKSLRHLSAVNEDGEQVNQVTGHAISPEDNATEQDNPFADPPEAQGAQDPAPPSPTDSTSTTASAQNPPPVADPQDELSDQRRATLAYTEYDVIDAYGDV